MHTFYAYFLLFDNGEKVRYIVLADDHDHAFFLALEEFYTDYAEDAGKFINTFQVDNLSVCVAA